MRMSADDAPHLKYGKAKATGPLMRRVAVLLRGHGVRRNVDIWRVPERTSSEEDPRWRKVENGHQTDREMGSESPGKRTGIPREMVAAPEESPWRTEDEPALLTAKKIPEEDEETESAAHTLRVEDEIDGRTLGRTGVTPKKDKIALTKGTHASHERRRTPSWSDGEGRKWPSRGRQDEWFPDEEADNGWYRDPAQGRGRRSGSLTEDGNRGKGHPGDRRRQGEKRRSFYKQWRRDESTDSNLDEPGLGDNCHIQDLVKIAEQTEADYSINRNQNDDRLKQQLKRDPKQVRLVMPALAAVAPARPEASVEPQQWWHDRPVPGWIQCHKCRGYGHVRRTCTSEVDLKLEPWRKPLNRALRRPELWRLRYPHLQ
jgi:hypothetical protein